MNKESGKGGNGETMRQNSCDMRKASVELRRKRNEKQNESEAKGTVWRRKKDRWKNAMKS